MTRFLPALALASALGLASATFAAEPSANAEKYVLDASHSQIVFTYNHLGFSTGTGMFSGFDGEIMFDQKDPAASSVTVSVPGQVDADRLAGAVRSSDVARLLRRDR